MMQQVTHWLAGIACMALALAQGPKDRVSVPPPKSDLLVDLPAVEDPAVAFPLLTRRVTWKADHPLQIVGGSDSFVLLERLFDGDPIQAPDTTLGRMFSENGAAGFSVPVLRKGEQPLALFFSQVKPYPERSDNWYTISGALGEDIVVMAYRSVRGRNHVTSGDSRIEVIDFRAKVAMAFVGSWFVAEKACGGDHWPAEKQDSDDLRVVRVELDDQYRAKSTESLLVRRL